MKDVNNKLLSIEDINGNIIMQFKIDNDYNIIDLINCEIADITSNTIRIQQEEYIF
jgi:hypothetical protein